MEWIRVWLSQDGWAWSLIARNGNGLVVAWCFRIRWEIIVFPNSLKMDAFTSVSTGLGNEYKLDELFFDQLEAT
jgi:hypothetical protein